MGRRTEHARRPRSPLQPVVVPHLALLCMSAHCSGPARCVRLLTITTRVASANGAAARPARACREGHVGMHVGHAGIHVYLQPSTAPWASCLPTSPIPSQRAEAGQVASPHAHGVCVCAHSPPRMSRDGASHRYVVCRCATALALAADRGCGSCCYCCGCGACRGSCGRCPPPALQSQQAVGQQPVAQEVDLRVCRRAGAGSWARMGPAGIVMPPTFLHVQAGWTACGTYRRWGIGDPASGTHNGPTVAAAAVHRRPMQGPTQSYYLHVAVLPGCLEGQPALQWKARPTSPMQAWVMHRHTGAARRGCNSSYLDRPCRRPPGPLPSPSARADLELHLMPVTRL